MKKRNSFSRSMAALIAAGTLCAALPAVPFTAAAAGGSGDVNVDGTTSALDVVALQKYLVRQGSLSRQGAANADVTGDGKVNVIDLAALKQMLVADPVTNVVYIHLKGNSITVEGDDNKVVNVNGTTATITASGQYYVDGSITDGQLYVKTAASDVNDVELILTDTTFTNSTKSAIYTDAETGSDKTKITLNGTNTMTDTAAAAYTTGSGVIFTNNKLTVTRNSTGTLNIASYMNDAIHSEKKLNINGGTITIDTDTAPVDGSIIPDADAIVSDKNIEIENAVLDLDASGDGIKSGNAGVYITSGDISVKAGADAIQAATELAVSGGNVVAGGDRGIRLNDGALLNITGGTVVATATDYQFNNGITVDTSGSTQAIMTFDMAAEWKKANTIMIGTNEYAATKKYDYVFISDSTLGASDTYKVYVGGSQMKHSTDASGSFKNTGTLTQYYAVDVLSGGETVVTSDNVVSSIVYSTSSVALYNASGAAVSASAAENVQVSNNTYVTITKSGAYTVSGTSTNGQLKVSTDDTAEPAAIVEMSFDGLTLSNSTAAPVYIENVGDEAVISAKNGTTSTISDGTSHTDTYTNSEGETKTCAAAIYARDDLKLKGKGTLVVKGNYEDGIVSTNDIKLWNGDIQVTAVDDGIRGDTVKIGDADDLAVAGAYDNLKVTVNTNGSTTGGDGIKASSTDTGKGIVLINGGSVNINAYADGIQAEQDFTMNGGDLTIYTYQGSGYTGSGTSTGSTTTDPRQGGFNPGGMGQDGNSNKTDISAKGIKAVGLYDASGTTWQSLGNITVNGGNLTVNSSDDALHCGGDMTLVGGVFTLESADDGLHSDHALTIGKSSANTFDDVQIYISKCYEGVEGVDIVQNSGTVYVIAGDDGYNAAGGTDGSGSTNPGGFGPGGMSTSTGTLTLNGGLGIVNSASGDHDAFDSNGNFTITGGYFYANGQEPMDYDGTFTNNGGSIMTMTVGNTNLTSRYSFVDSSGKVIVSFLSGSGSPGATCSGCTAYSGGTVSGGTTILSNAGSQAVTVGGTLSGGSQITQSASTGGGGMQPW
ncbi:MAG: carbohydrate-binding domain-containing protein [Oscillospiraceae bacterium]|nr:carbohydrate-binding domain-containing protein [Oscillospiraceae bacterium]